MNAAEILNPAEIKTASIKPTAERVAAILAKEKPTKTERAELVLAIWVVHHHSTSEHNSKLDGLDSISTNTRCNEFCNSCRKNPELICSHCYADRDMKCYTALAEHNTINAAILQSILFTKSELAFVGITASYTRVESFGEVANVTQARNYTRLIRANPSSHFGIWTKRPDIWLEAFTLEGGKPRNTTFVISSPRINTPAEPAPSIAPLVDHTFTVYDRAAIKSGVSINCGGKRCMDCIKARKGCYYRTSTRNPYEIREQIK